MDASEVFDYPFMIREGHLDTFGHVNNATYLQILEEARWDLITQRGFGLAEVIQRQLGPIILEIQLRFIRELKARDQVVIKTWVTSYKGKIGTMEQLIVKTGEIKDSSGSQDAKVKLEACHANFKFGLFDMKTRKIILPTPEWRHAIGIEID